MEHGAGPHAFFHQHPNAALRLRAALEIGPREVVALVGAGGKTTCMFRLARELREAGERVIVTTTTKILVPPPSAGVALVLEADRDTLLYATRLAVARGEMPVVGRGVTPEGKLDGVPADWVADLAGLPGVTHVLVEADGAARKPLKAPREDEPVIPACATLVISVVGADALGQPLLAEVVHRPERFAALTGVGMGDRLEVWAVARVAVGPLGNTRGTPPGARVVALVNKADSPERLAAARQLAAELRRQGAARVVVAAVASDPPVVEVVG